MKKKKKETNSSEQFKNVALLHALNEAAALIQGSALSESKVYKVFQKEINNLNLRGSIILLDKNQDYFIFATVGGKGTGKTITALEKFTNKKLKNYKFKIEKIDIYKKVITTNKTFFIENSREIIIQHLSGKLKKIIKPILNAITPAPTIVAPLIVEKQVFGVLNIAGKGLTSNDIPALQAFANHIAIALKNARLFNEIKKTETKYRCLIESSNDAIFVIDPSKYNILTINPKAVKMTGYSETELLKMSIIDIHPANTAKEIQDFYKETRAKGHSLFELPLQRKNSNILIVQISASVYEVDEQKMMQILFRDITKQKQIEVELRESESIFRMISEQSLFAIAILQDGFIKYVNKAAEKIIGYSQEEMYNWPANKFGELVHQEDRRRAIERAEKKQRGDSDMDPGSIYRIITKSKKRRWIKQYSKTISFQGRPALMAALIDITEQKKAENALASEKKLLDVTLHAIGDGVITTDIKGKVILINKAAETLTGWPEKEAIGKKFEKVFHITHKRIPKLIINPAEEILQTGKILRQISYKILILKNRTKRMIAYSGAPIHDNENNIIGTVMVFRDVTEKQKMENEMIKIQKLESLGVLAGGIAHDFNNILLVILGNIDLAMGKTEKNNELYELLNKAENGLMRAQNLTNQLLTFARGGTPVKTFASITEIILESSAFSLRGSNVKCSFNFPDDLWQVEVDTGQISQVFNNLFINADHAMTTGGRLEIKAENTVIKDKDRLPLPSGQYIKITIRDKGPGISEKNISKIFDPYFSTKKKGSGLGLAICYSIIEKHDGYITAESRPGRGAVFYIYLPSLKKKIEKKHDIVHQIIKGTGKILIIDDDEDVLNTVAPMLKSIGFKTSLTKESFEAISTFKKARESDSPFNVVILDLTIPGELSSKMTMVKLREIDKNIKIIVSSGYSNDPIMSKYKEYGFDSVIAKPYKIDKLNKILNKVINK